MSMEQPAVVIYGTNAAVAALVGGLASGGKYRLQPLGKHPTKYDSMQTERALLATVAALKQQWSKTKFIKVEDTSND